MSGTRSTRDFLNLLRVVGRMWGSHGDKITTASQGRNVDDEKADKLRGRADPPSRSESPSPWGDVGGSPAIHRQRSVETLTMGSTNSAAPSPSILRQVSRDLVSPTPMMIGPLPPAAVLRQASREIAAARQGAQSPVPNLQRQTSTAADLPAFSTSGIIPPSASATTARPRPITPSPLTRPTTPSPAPPMSSEVVAPRAAAKKRVEALWEPGRFIGIASAMLRSRAAADKKARGRPYAAAPPTRVASPTHRSITGA